MKRVRKVRISKVRLCIPSQVTSSLACTGTLKFLGAPRTGPKTVHFQSICGGGKVNYGNNRTAVVVVVVVVVVAVAVVVVLMPMPMLALALAASTATVPTATSPARNWRPFSELT